MASQNLKTDHFRLHPVILCDLFHLQVHTGPLFVIPLRVMAKLGAG